MTRDLHRAPTRAVLRRPTSRFKIRVAKGDELLDSLRKSEDGRRPRGYCSSRRTVAI